MTVMKNFVVVFLFLFTAFLLSSCSSKTETASQGSNIPVEQVQKEETQKGSGSEIQEGVIGSEGILEPGGVNAISEGRTSAPFLPVYFDFDRYTIKPDMQERMEKNAQVMLDHPEIKIEIQGNCDERGTNEYNLALGEKRAKAAKDYLVMLGVSPERISVVSLGEERPLALGHNETAWAQNRRDDFIIYR